MRQSGQWRNGGGSRSWRDGSRRDVQEGWEDQFARERSRGIPDWDEGRFDRGAGRGISQRPEWESSEGGYSRESGREDSGMQRGGSYGSYPGSSYRRGEYGEGYQGGPEERGYGSRRDFDEESRYSSQREQPYPRNYWNPEPQYGRESRQSGQFGGGYSSSPYGGAQYSGGQHGGSQSGSQYGGGQFGGSQYGRGGYGGSQYGSRGSMESNRQGYPQSGHENARSGGSGVDSERWDRSGSEWSGMSQDSGRTGQRSMSSGGARTNRGPKNYKRSDERIREDVCDQLSDSDLNCEEVEVNVKNGEVTLTGTTDSGHTRRDIERVTETVSGVKDVTNQIRIRRESSTTGENRTSSTTSDNPSMRRDTVKAV